MSGMVSALVAPGAIVAGKYRLDTIVGEGGMGSVWSATHTGLGQAVAIKFISKEFVTSAEALRRFDAEAKAAAQLRSRHVVQVFDNGTLEDGTPYIAMELLRGENLYARVHRGGAVPLPEAIEILAQCGKALGRAHSAGIVHRDIKPDNIFLAQSADDEAVLVKILDFGIAKFATNPSDHGNTRTGAVLGTPLYMSPEQARGLKTIDHRTDIYSLGLVAYTMLTGNLAFSSESFGDLLVQICTAPLPSLCANAPWLPPATEFWFQRACARDPQNRFASAQEFVDALRAVASGAYGAPGPAPGLVPGALASGVTPFPAQGGMAASHGAQAVSVGTDGAMSRSGPSVTASPSKGKGAAVIAVAALLLVAGLGVAAFVMLSGHTHAPEGTPPVVAAAPLPSAPGSASPTTLVAQPGVGSVAPVASLTPAAPGAVLPTTPAGAASPTTPPGAASPTAPTPDGQHANGPPGGHAPPHSGAMQPTAPPRAANGGGAAAPVPPPPGTKPIDLGY